VVVRRQRVKGSSVPEEEEDAGISGMGMPGLD